MKKDQNSKGYTTMSGRLIVEPCAGLGNRIYALVSARQVARNLEMEFAIVWKKEEACYAEMHTVFDCNVFDCDIYEITEMPRKYLADLIGTCKGNSIKAKLRSGSVFISKNTREKIKERFFYSLDPELVYYVKSVRSLIAADECDFSIIKPSQIVLNRASAIWERIGNDTVGIHIRRTDHIYAIKNSPIDFFIREIESEIQNNDKVNFFVCSDDKNMIEELKKRYGQRILTFCGEKTRRSEQGIVDAAVDMFGLSKCYKIIGSSGSTFSQVAARIGNVQLVVS